MESLPLCLFVLGYMILAAIIAAPLSGGIGMVLLKKWNDSFSSAWLSHRNVFVVIFLVLMMLACIGLLILNPTV